MWGSRRLLATRRSPKAAGAWRRTSWSGVGYRQHHKWASIDLLARANTQRPSPLTSITPWEPELITLDNVYYVNLPANRTVVGRASWRSDRASAVMFPAIGATRTRVAGCQAALIALAGARRRASRCARRARPVRGRSGGCAGSAGTGRALAR